MSAQMHDKIFYQGKEYGLAATPLSDYFMQNPEKQPEFRGFNTACMRGYVAEWEVRAERLYLTGMRMVLSTDASFNSLFPNAGAEGVFADWVSGELKCPHGKLLKSNHAAFDSVWEEELRLSFVNGVLTGVSEVRETEPK